MDKRAIRVNVEVVYDDGTVDELALEKPLISSHHIGLVRYEEDWRRLELSGYAVDP